MRYGSDFARAWARMLRFGDVRAKSLLMAVCNYVDEEGAAIPGIPTLAQDTDQSEDSVRRRLKDLEEFGVIARFARYVDNNGRINSEGRGRRTSDEIRCIFASGQEVVDAALARRGSGSGGEADPGQQQGSAHEVDPSQQQGSDPSQQQGAPSTAATPISIEPKKEERIPPTPLKGGIAPVSPDGEEEKDGQAGAASDAAAPGPADGDGWSAFEAAFTADGAPLLRVSIARHVWSALSPAERETATVAARGYIAWRKAERKPPGKASPQTFLRERDAWPRFVALAPPPPPPKAGFVGEDEPLFAALSVCHRIVTGKWLVSEPVIGQARKGTTTLADRRPDLLAMAPFAGGEAAGWIELDAADAGQRQQIAAWRDRVKLWTGWLVDTTKVAKLDAGGNRVMRTMPGLGRTYDMPVWREVLRVPLAWPPRRDGTLGENEHEDVESIR